ncbi:hypothetical protein T265_04620 [Opisthorchis viverrini]|uniref:Uncharacterized protein n=1 Tax=Opisthorchis viverrini TaxID=6198 RepID=A0A074ZRX0_OPIVI|nr:hypothetical protein T265_04620 [Opisthorchis viverrini]KER28577.1 hypothetical protein T265_04620 [Opisthorchis viverrini]
MLPHDDNDDDDEGDDDDDDDGDVDDDGDDDDDVDDNDDGDDDDDDDGAAAAEKSIPRQIGREFGTLVGPASSRDLIGRKSGPNSQSWPNIGLMPVANAASRMRQSFRLRYIYEALYNCS